MERSDPSQRNPSFVPMEVFDGSRSSSGGGGGHHKHNHGRSQDSVRLMNFFDTPPSTTVFGTKKSEHWDSFKSKYAPSRTTTSSPSSSRSSLATRARTIFLRGGNRREEDSRRARRRRRRSQRRNQTGRSTTNQTQTSTTTTNTTATRSLVWALLGGCWRKRNGNERSSDAHHYRYRGDPDHEYDFGFDHGFESENDAAGFRCEARAGHISSRQRNRTPLVERYSEYFDRRRMRSRSAALFG